MPAFAGMTAESGGAAIARAVTANSSDSPLSACRNGENSFEKILIPPRLRALILSAPGSLSLRHLEWRRGKELGPAPDNGAAQSSLREFAPARRMERPEAQPASQAGARPRKARGLPDRKGGPKGLASPWRLPALHSPFLGKRKKGTAYLGPIKEHGR